MSLGPLFTRFEEWLRALQGRRGLQLAVANLRLAIGFGFLPAGLKKVLGQPFTDPEKVGVFHEFLHAFHAAGPLYTLVGSVQLLGSFLLLTQRFATLGAALLLPVLVAITALCWSSAGIPTIVTVTLMTLGVSGLLLWDFARWRGLVIPQFHTLRLDARAPAPAIAVPLWERCGLAIFLVYVSACALQGGVYRPKGLELDQPAFYLLPVIALFPLVTYLLDRRTVMGGSPD